MHESVGVLRNSFCSFMHIMGCWGAAGGREGGHVSSRRCRLLASHTSINLPEQTQSLADGDASQEAFTRQAVPTANQQWPPRFTKIARWVPGATTRLVSPRGRESGVTSHRRNTFYSCLRASPSSSRPSEHHKLPTTWLPCDRHAAGGRRLSRGWRGGVEQVHVLGAQNRGWRRPTTNNNNRSHQQPGERRR